MIALTIWLSVLTFYADSHIEHVWDVLDQMAVQMVESHKTMMRKEP
jgi:hypothetical protein